MERFHGMFAFAIWERDSGRVMLARDRLGIKPLYFSAGGKRLRFASSLPALLAAGDVDTDIDPAAFERILGNLITNALRYGSPPIRVQLAPSDRHLRVAVEDSGPGVSSEFIPYLFDRFRRSERSQRLAQGTGLGLAIARAYARAHGGDIVYTPARPHGARFELVLPLPPR